MPIYEDVILRLDERSARAVSEQMEDAAREGVQAFNRQASTAAAGGLRSSMQRAGREASSTLRTELQRGVSDAVSGVTSQFGALGRVADSTLRQLPAGATAAAAGIGAITIAVAAVGKALYDVGKEWDEVSDSITITTGRVGDDLKNLTGIVQDVGGTTAASLQVIGDVTAQISQSMPDLAQSNAGVRQMASNLSYLRANGKAVDIRELGMAFRAFDVPAADQVKALDALSNASRNTGIPLNELISTVRAGAPQFKQFGLDIGQATGLLASFAQAGVAPDAATTGLRVALKNLNDDSRGATVALADVITSIKALHDAGNDPAASQIAEKTFGRGFAPFLEAIESGALNVQNLNKALTDTGISLANMQDATDDGAQSWDKLVNKVKSELKPAADATFTVINTQVSLMTHNFSDALSVFDSLDDKLGDARDKLTQARQEMEHLANVQITPDSALGKMLTPAGLAGAQTPGVALPGGLGSAVAGVPGHGLQLPGGLLAPQWGSRDVAGPGGSRSSGSSGGPQVPYGPLPAVAPGVPMTPEVYSAQSSYWEAQHTLAEKKALVEKLESDTSAKADDRIAARNERDKAERDQHEAEMRFYQTQQNAYEKQFKQLDKAAGDLGDIGAKLDQDFGISKGLGGIVENFTKMLANFGAAPILGALKAGQIANGFRPGDAGSGLSSIFANSGVFGPQYVAQPSLFGNYSPSALGPAMLRPGFMPSILEDTGRTPSGPQSRTAAAYIEQLWGDQLRGKIGGSRDNNTAKGTHDAGLSIDIPIGPDQKALGDEINAWLQANAGELGLKYSIWRDRGQYPGGGGFNQSGHQDHIDAHFNGASVSPSNPMPVSIVNTPGMSPSGFNWDAVAAKESSGNWQNNDTGGNGHYGGLQFSPSTWNQFGGQEFAPMPNLATPEQQKIVADRTAFYGYGGNKPQGLSAWEVITNGSTAADGITVNSRPPAGGGTGGGGGFPGFAGPPQSSPFGPMRLGGGGLGLDIPAPGGGPGVDPTLIGGLAPKQGSGKGGIGLGQGGILGAALGAASSGAGLAASGAMMGMDGGAGGAVASAAMQIGIQEINRAIQFGSQAAGILADGFMQTFLPFGASEFAQNNWLTKGIGAVVGAGVMLPNIAGGSDKKKTPEGLTPEQAAQYQKGQGPKPEDVAGKPGDGVGGRAGQTIDQSKHYTTTIQSNADSLSGTAKDWEYHLGAAATPVGG